MFFAHKTVLLAAVLLVCLLSDTAEAFVKGTSRVHARPVTISTTSRGAAKKGAAKKGAAKKETAKKIAPAKAKAEPVETMRKTDVVAAIAERMECTKIEAENALAAVVGTVQDVSDAIGESS
jgi:hypothetical protein